MDNVLILLGEKYELAKKMKKIKLVNHRWLEDWYVKCFVLALGNLCWEI